MGSCCANEKDDNIPKTTLGETKNQRKNRQGIQGSFQGNNDGERDTNAGTLVTRPSNSDSMMESKDLSELGAYTKA